MVNCQQFRDDLPKRLEFFLMKLSLDIKEI